MYSTSNKLIFLYIETIIATKHAVEAITGSLRHELVDTPIRVSAICPGLVDTEVTFSFTMCWL